jgi:putative ABC transport system substrate-binding protein
MERRTFIGVLAGAGLAAPLAVEAQQAGKVWRIGLLSYAASDSGGAARWKAFREQLRELGYVEGQNVFFESRWGDVQVGRLRGLAAELMRRSTSW